MIDESSLDILVKVIGGVIIMVITALYGRSVMIRRLSKDGLLVAQDTGQVDVIGVLQDERNALLRRIDKLTEEREEAVRMRSEAMLEIGGLRNEGEHHRRTIADQSRKILDQSVMIESLQKQVAALNDQIQSLVGLKDVGISIESPKKP